MTKKITKQLKDEAKTRDALAEAIDGLMANARLVDVTREDDCRESQIYRERFFSTVQKIGNALNACIEARAALETFRAIFGDDGLAVEEAAQ